MAGGWMEFLLLVPAGVMTAQDFRSREVGSVWLLLFAAGAVGLSVWHDGWRTMAGNTALNLSLALYLALGVVLYLRVRTKRWTNPLRAHFGAGDLLFILGAAPLFGLRTYLSFLLVSMAAGLLWWGIIKTFLHRTPTIPLVGIMGFALAGFLIFHNA